MARIVKQATNKYMASKLWPPVLYKQRENCIEDSGHGHRHEEGKTDIFRKDGIYSRAAESKFKQTRSVVNSWLFDIRDLVNDWGRLILCSPKVVRQPSGLGSLRKQGLDASDRANTILGDQDSPLLRQRFAILLHRALKLCAELRGLGERWSPAIEKETGFLCLTSLAQHHKPRDYAQHSADTP